MTESCPECQQGKHDNCDGLTLNKNDDFVECPCYKTNHGRTDSDE